MKDLMAKVSRWFEREEVPQRVVRVDDLGFEVFSGENFCYRVPWEGVVEIATFKRDLFSYDEVCLAYRLRGWDKFWDVGEEDVGFAEVRTETERRFSSISPSWYADVSAPAFEEKWTRIWGSPPLGPL